jgi:hypothetical protein
MMAERVGFVHLRGFAATVDLIVLVSQPSRGLPTVAHAIGKRERRLAERVGFEPTCRLPDNTLSRRARYDHFGTSPNL